MSAIAQHRRLSPLRATSLQALNQHFEELNTVLREMQIQTSESRGLTGSAVPIAQHLDVQGNRVQNVGATRTDTDAPNVRELRQQALYARNGVHETEHLILAKGGIRSVTPAIASNDVLTLGQARHLFGVGTSTQGLGSVTSGLTLPDAAWAWTQTAVTLPNGLTVDWAVPAAVFLRITGPTAPFAIGGLTDIADGRFLILQQTTAQTMTLLNEHAATPASHRITTGSGTDLVMDGPGMTMLLYSPADSRWWSL